MDTDEIKIPPRYLVEECDFEVQQYIAALERVIVDANKTVLRQQDVIKKKDVKIDELYKRVKDKNRALTTRNYQLSQLRIEHKILQGKMK